MKQRKALERARTYFLSSGTYGCAETTMMVLQEAYELRRSLDPSAAMALNGGVAWRGGPCGVLLGAAIALGELAGQRVGDHKDSKRIARRLLAQFIDAFEIEYGAVNCRQLVGRDIYTADQHAEFIASGIWRDICMGQIEFAVQALLPLRDEGVWRQAVAELDAAD